MTSAPCAEPGTVRGTVKRPNLYWLLALVPVSVVLRILGQDLAVFIISAVAIVPLAGLIGRGTDQLALHARPSIAALPNATFRHVTAIIPATLPAARTPL